MTTTIERIAEHLPFRAAPPARFAHSIFYFASLLQFLALYIPLIFNFCSANPIAGWCTMPAKLSLRERCGYASSSRDR